MILYFSGTGNSLYAAKKLLDENERLVSIAELIKKDEYDIELTDNEKLGLVFPVYFYTVPTIVREFLEKADIKNSDYVYSVITCGGGTGQASAVLKKILLAKDIKLSYFKELLMPDNGMLFYQIDTGDKVKERLISADEKLKTIKEDISQKKTTLTGDSSFSASLLEKMYRLCSKTKKFYAEDTCTGCGLCERNCPSQAIKLKNNKPVWKSETCCKCSACINRCPVKAIQYGKQTKKRNRYVNPYL